MSEEEIVKALTNAMPHDILVNTNWTLYKDTKAKDKEIERLNNIINKAQKKIDEILSKPSNVLQYIDLKEFKDILKGSDKEC